MNKRDLAVIEMNNLLIGAIIFAKMVLSNIGELRMVDLTHLNGIITPEFLAEIDLEYPELTYLTTILGNLTGQIDAALIASNKFGVEDVSY